MKPNNPQITPNPWQSEDFPNIYEEMKRIAHNRLQFESKDLTLNTTDLVHEAYLKMSAQRVQNFANKNHFYAMASTAMRRILINYALQKKSQKRGGDLVRITMTNNELVAETSMEDILDLDDAMKKYSQLSSRGSKIIEYWFFSGFNQGEIAKMMDISVATVKREWTLARHWLSREMNHSQLNMSA